MTIYTSTKRREIEINDDINLDDYDSTNFGPNIVTPPVFRRQLIIVDIIGNNYTSLECMHLFNTKIDESVYDCLSQQIEIFEAILNNKRNIVTIANRGNDKDSLETKYTYMSYKKPI